MSRRNRAWVLASRPDGPVRESDFRLVETDVRSLEDGEVLVQVHYLSLDPYMRGRMSAAKSYAPSQELGQVMIGGTVGAVIESRSPRFKPGDIVAGMGGWQLFHTSNGSNLSPVDTRLPEPAYLGAVGMPGVTAWYGLHRIGKPRSGETVVVSAASGAVGGVVGQLAKLAGCRAVGIAGGPVKCEHVVKELGFDACVDHRSDAFVEALRAATPDGIDIVFENVGGKVLDATLHRMNAFGRVAVCGLIAGYDGQEIPLQNVRDLLTNRISMQGFIVSDHMELWPEALSELGRLVAQGRLRHHETIAQGLESAPRAFIGLLRGEHLGKQLVKLV
jgi:NADPH-dependent curcumin reductase CurA